MMLIQESASSPHFFQMSVAPDPARVADVRHEVTHHLHRWQLSHLADAAELVTSELVTNGLRHGGGDSVTVAVEHTGDTVLIAVDDGSPQIPVARSAGEEDENGRGLMILEHIASAWGTKTTSTGKQTWAVLPAAIPEAGTTP